MTDQVKPLQAALKSSTIMFHRQPKTRAGVAEHLCPKDRKVGSTDYKNIHFPAGRGDLSHEMLLKPWLPTLRQRICQTSVTVLCLWPQHVDVSWKSQECSDPLATMLKQGKQTLCYSLIPVNTHISWRLIPGKTMQTDRGDQIHATGV